jgi:methyl-accepting chemotaxis protein
MRLAYKFLLITVVVVAGFGAVTYTVHAMQKNENEIKLINNQASLFNEIVSDVEIGIQNSRRNEKDFLLSNNPRYADNNEGLVTKVSVMLDKLHDMSPDDDSQEVVVQLHETINKYMENFKALVGARKKMGLDHNSGLHGKLRKAVHDVEKTLKTHNQIVLSHSMLMMRRHEKDYMARKLDKYVDKMASEQKRFTKLLQEADLPSSAKATISTRMETYHKTFLELPPLHREIEGMISAVNDAVLMTDLILIELIEARDVQVTGVQQLASATTERLTRNFYLITLGIIIAVVLLVLLVARIITRSVQAASTIADSVAAGNLENDIEIRSNDETGQLLRSLQTMQTNLSKSIESERHTAAANNRIKQALDNSSNNIMLVSSDNLVIYINRSMQQYLEEAGTDFSSVFPGLDINDVTGTSVEQFFINPEQQRKLMGNLGKNLTFDFPVGGRYLQVTTSPVFNDEDKQTGIVMEWRDRTQEVAIEEEIKNIVIASLSGDLSQRINMTGKAGFFKTLSKDINNLVDVSERVIKDTAQVMNAIANGDLTRSVEADYEGSFDDLKQDINTTIGKLTSIMGEIAHSSSTVLTASGEIAQGNTNLSQRTDEQSASLEEVASSMEKITTTVLENADNAREANQLASGTRTQAEHGGQVVNNAINAMSEITGSSKKIADIIGVIDEIAFQTNLLALNAAVEAARAGEQGRGFAVVASEVRNLAGRSATAAKEIKDLIKDSVIKVKEGSKLVNESGETLGAITNSVNSVSNIIAEIATASQQQSASIEQVNKAIMNMDEMTQQNAALVEQAAATSNSMDEQARKLNELVGFFSIGESTSFRGMATERRNTQSRPWGESESTGAAEQYAPGKTGTDKSSA